MAVAGIGRMGMIHALHVHELERDTGTCELAAIATLDKARADQFLSEIGRKVPVFASVDELAKAGVCDATVVVTPTNCHREHATRLIKTGQRILLEKPLTGTLEGDREFAAELDAQYPNAVMLAFQRRFDEAMQYAKQLLDGGMIGRVIKVYSALEDSGPAPDGFKSPGILPDMSIHNVDEVLWLTGRVPTEALSIGSRIYSHKLTKCEEDFDDGLLCMWFGDDLMAQVQVTRNHVSGYRVETIIYGDAGQVHVGRFEGKPFEARVEAYGKRGQAEPLAMKTFRARDYAMPLPEFVDRFGAAYKAELQTFIECCAQNKPFPVTHRDGLQAQEVIAAGMRNVCGRNNAARVGA